MVPKKRSMSSHVATRNYRAPEIILLENYDTASDIWSLGCIAYELCKVVSGVTQDTTLFSGDHCHPLSPRKNGD